jgi:hypothetical protein
MGHDSTPEHEALISLPLIEYFLPAYLAEEAAVSLADYFEARRIAGNPIKFPRIAIIAFSLSTVGAHRYGRAIDNVGAVRRKYAIFVPGGLSQWLALREIDNSIRKPIDSLAQCAAGTFACVVLSLFGYWLTGNYLSFVPCLFGALFAGLFWAQWSDWHKDFADLISGRLAFTDAPECSRVSAGLVEAARNGERLAQSLLGENYRIAALETVGVRRLFLLLAAELWLRKAAERGDLFAQKH